MEKFIKFICCYLICLTAVSYFWVGLEYILEGATASSEADDVIALILSYFITDKYIDKLF